MIPPFSQWPPELYFLYCERAAIKVDSHIPEAEAEAAAKQEVWNRHAEPVQGGFFEREK